MGVVSWKLGVYKKTPIEWVPAWQRRRTQEDDGPWQAHQDTTNNSLLPPTDDRTHAQLVCWFFPEAVGADQAPLRLLSNKHVGDTSKAERVVGPAGTLAVSTPVSGSIAVGGGSQAVDITRPGQTARITFSGTSGQLLRLSWASAVVSGGSSVAVSVLKPDGTTLSSGSFINAATGYLDIASLPSTGTYTVVLDPSSAATLSVPLTLATR